MENLKNTTRQSAVSFLNSYSIIYFSQNRLFAFLILLVSFLDPVAGLSGMIAVVFSNGLAMLLGYNRENTLFGYYGFNALLVGLGLGSLYSFSPGFLVVLLSASLLTLMLSVVFEGVVGKYGLPFLTLPFLVSVWLLMLATRHYSMLQLSERGIYMHNEMYWLGGPELVGLYDWFNRVPIPQSLAIYFKSLSAIVFQYHLFGGILIALGLAWYSRIAFLLSIAGFYSAYLFYQLVGSDFNELQYSYIGFNFILTSIAVGGFFLVSSRASFFWVILLTPLISILSSATGEVLAYFQLPVYSLPFNLVVIVFLYNIRFRHKPGASLKLVSIQEFSPEKNLYTTINSAQRFSGQPLIQLNAPFLGEWKVSQAHNGEETHKDRWRHAWDFMIYNTEGKSHTGQGMELPDYYCFGKPVIAPADGWVEEIVDAVEDNPVGKPNFTKNWGNVIILKHSEGLYTKLCHLKNGSFRVSRGAHVKKGEILALCGNSGRSPIPHLHFQVQATPYIGSETLDYPLSNYLLHNPAGYSLVPAGRPANGDMISRFVTNRSLDKAFRFIPGQTLRFSVVKDGQPAETVEWEVLVDIYNNPYIRCRTTGSRAWFRTDSASHYFTWFEGERNSLLFHFYCHAYKILNGPYEGTAILDSIPLSAAGRRFLKVLQDFVAPFFLFMRLDYRLSGIVAGDSLNEDKITIHSAVELEVLGRKSTVSSGSIYIDVNEIREFTVTKGKSTVSAQRLEDDVELKNGEHVA